ncbi:MAG: hypothetical protein G01um101417_399 [Parcubacteria group bacterium Gr01-1014_17]|nr:MAG: hypothetical protein G01um101417_399 [Parcubacteria group bacterium Gr01-1014_17]
MNESHHQFRFFASFAVAGALVGALAGVSSPSSLRFAEERAPGAAYAIIGAAITAPSPFDEVVLTAGAAEVFDVSTGKTIFEKNADAQLPLASLTKIMTAVTALAIAPSYALVPLNNEQWPLKDLLSFSLAASSNEGAAAAAAVAGSFVSGGGDLSDNRNQFITAMNGESEKFGLTETYFLNETGLDESEGLAGGYGSAHDVARLISRAYLTHPELFDATTKQTSLFTKENGNKHEADNTNKIVTDIPLLRASKTGLTDLAGGNLAIVFDAGVGKPIAIAVLGSTEDERFEDVKTLVAATLQYLQKDDPK